MIGWMSLGFRDWYFLVFRARYIEIMILAVKLYPSLRDLQHSEPKNQWERNIKLYLGTVHYKHTHAHTL
jgi:hypothetical protein